MCKEKLVRVEKHTRVNVTATRCEMCNDTDDAADNPMYDCDACRRMYHAKCMHLSKLLGDDEAFTCECCRHGTDEDHQNRELLVVSWKPSGEPASVLDHDTEVAVTIPGQ